MTDPTPFAFAEVSFKQGRVGRAQQARRGDNDGVATVLSAYAEVVDALVRDGAARLVFAHCPDGQIGGSGRVVLSGKAHEASVQAIATTVGANDPLGVVIIDDQFTARQDLRDLRHLVARDLAWVVSGQAVIRATGPVERMVPWLTGVAASIILFGETEDDALFAEDTVSRFTLAMAQKEFGMVNSMGKLETHHPDYMHIFDAVVHESQRRRSAQPTDLATIAASATRSVLAALSSLGVEVAA